MTYFDSEHDVCLMSRKTHVVPLLRAVSLFAVGWCAQPIFTRVFTSEQDYDSYGQMTQHGHDKVLEASHKETMRIIEEGRKQREETQRVLERARWLKKICGSCDSES